MQQDHFQVMLPLDQALKLEHNWVLLNTRLHWARFEYTFMFSYQEEDEKLTGLLSAKPIYRKQRNKAYLNNLWEG